MVDHAIVIGIDAYKREDWNLGAAVRDATAFAKWLINTGRVTRNTLTLLLSPLPGQEPTLAPDGPADRSAIHDALFKYARPSAPAVTGDTLWIYYAGHGVSAQGEGLDGAPVIVPADEDDLEDYLLDAPLGLAKYVRLLRAKASPSTQLYFLDCCRAMSAASAVTASTHLHWDMDKLGDNPKGAKQAVLCATAATAKAHEVGGHGLFSQALLEALAKLRAPLTPDPLAADWFLTLSSVDKYVRRRVGRLQEDAVRAGKQLEVQIPEPALAGTTGDLPLLRVAEPPRCTLGIVVEPHVARHSSIGGIWRESPDGGFTLQQTIGPGLAALEWPLRPNEYVVGVSAPGFRPWKQPIELDRDRQEVAILDPLPPQPEVGILLRGKRDLNEVLLEALASMDKDQGALAAGATGMVFVRTPDRLTRIEIFAADGRALATAQGGIDLGALPVGPYRVRITAPGEPSSERSVLVTAGSSTFLEQEVDPRPAPKALEAALHALSMSPHGGLAAPSEAFGPVVANRVGSLLAWAAWATRAPSDGWGHKLRAAGVALAPDTRMLVLVGDALDPASLAGLTLRAGPTGEEVERDPLAALPSVPAMQWSSSEGGITSVVLSGPSVGQLAVPVLDRPGFVDVVIVARESTRAVEVHRYLMPHADVGAPWAIRQAELGWRALAARTPLMDGDVQRTLADGADPLAFAVLGYRLAREGQPLEPVLSRLHDLGGELPDMHVLRALHDPGSRDQSLERITELGLPLVAEGARIVAEWMAARARAEGSVPVTPLKPRLDAEPWTLFDAAAAPRVSGVLPSAALSSLRLRWADGARAVSAATGRMEHPDREWAYSGTGFVAAPGFVVTSAVVTDGHDDGWQLRAGETMLALEGVGRVEREPAVGLALLEITGGPAPVRLSFDPPRPGQRIAVLAYAAWADRRLPPGVAMAVPSGEQAIVLGTVLGVSEDGSLFEYDAWTLGGAAGGPVMDLDTGEVIGVHHSGRYVESDTRKIGMGVPLSYLRDLLPFA